MEGLLAEAAIRTTMARYNQALDDGRWEDVEAVFTSDCVVRFPSGTRHGTADLVDGLMRGRRRLFNAGGPEAPLTVMRHHLSSIVIAVDGDRADARSYFLVVADGGPDHSGVYVDRFRRVDGDWLISERKAVVEWQATTSRWPTMIRHDLAS